ncbi:MAG: hypothetical protein K9I85_00860 [Saprospiraceae bacterium]|nr:hypothetical protein [Saprospiraceae bacterium]
MRAILLLLFIFLFESAFGQLGIPRSYDPASIGQGGIQSLDRSRYQPLGNPAILGALKTAEAGAFLVQPFGLNDLAITYAHAAVQAGSGAVGAGIGYSGVNGYRAISTHLSFGHKLWNRLFAGIGMDLYYLDLADYGHTYAMGITGGLVFPILSGLDLGVILRYPFSIATSGTEDLPVYYQATLSYALSESVTLSTEWLQEADFQSDIRVGITYRPLPQLPVRIGYQSLNNGFTAGLGYQWQSRWSLDVAAGHHAYLGFTPSAGFRYRFSQP